MHCGTMDAAVPTILWGGVAESFWHTIFPDRFGHTFSTCAFRNPLPRNSLYSVANLHALLIGVPRYEDPELNYPQLGAAVSTDGRAMRAALVQSGYAITDCGLDDARGEATPTRIRRAIKSACADVPAGGVLMIYFSGHGITVGGQDYLVPSDAYLSDARSEVSSLVPVVPDASALRGCRAALVVFFVDACRSDPASEAPLGSSPAIEPGGQQPYLAGGGQFVLVMGCSAGQTCNYDEEGSVFTQALAKVLDPRNPARTLRDVVDSVTDDMGRRSRQQPDQAQGPVVRNRAVLDRAGNIVICDGDELGAAWRKAVNASALLPLCTNPDQVFDIVAQCARRCGDARDALRRRRGLADPWTDQNYPGRVLRSAEILLRNADFLPVGESASSPPPHGLRSGEVATLIAAPFLREAVLAEGIRDAADIDPANLERTYTPGARNDLELTHEMHQHLIRRAIGLREGGTAEAADQLVMWLVHRWLTNRVRLWSEPGAHEVYRLGRPLIQDCPGSAAPDEVPMLIQWLLLAIGAEQADERLVGKLASNYVDDGWRFIAAVLWLAGIMAADLRKLPPVVSNLVGTRMELPLADMQDAASRLAAWDWDDEAGTLDLRLVCEHPAMHDAFDNIVKRADRARKTIQAGFSGPSDVRARLPRTFSATRLRPRTRKSGDGEKEEKAYEVPLSRFQIAEEKVRELLMGRQLYGNPDLAIRELYQNALDACRWRETRYEYLAKTGKRPATWAGRIGFRRGTDAAGRLYIECEDNGVGMDLDTIEHVFANAGERFVYRQDFRAEQADWASKGLSMVSNSQFGIGVFSYFMLADEISVTTRHQLRTGLPSGQAYEVRIASSGSLIQINPAPDDALRDCGTAVRLYINGDAANISVLLTLRDLLWVAGYQVDVSDQHGEETWRARKLRYPGAALEPLDNENDLWWVPGQGGLAADGIKSEETSFGVVVNLRDERRPQLTVDRNTLRGWDSDWVTRQVGASLPNLMTWQGFTLSWLWQVTDDDVVRAKQIFDHGVSAGQQIPVFQGSAPDNRAALHVVGCLPLDNEVVRLKDYYSYGMWITAWRVGVWRSAALPADAEHVGAWRIEGFPVPDPVDGKQLSALARNIHNTRPDIGEILHSLIAFRDPPAAAREMVRAQLRRMRKYAITGIDLSAARRIPPVDAEVDGNTVSLIQCLAEWSAPGEPPRHTLPVAVLGESERLGWPIESLLRRVALLAPAGWTPPELDLEHLADGAFMDAEKIVLSRDADGIGPWLEGELLPAHLANVCFRLERRMAEVLEICDRLAPLGYTVPGRDAYPPELESIEIQALRRIDRPGQVLSPLQLTLIANEADISVGMAHRGLARLEVHGMLVRPDFDDSIDFTLTDRESELLTRQLAAYGGVGGNQFPLWLAETLFVKQRSAPEQQQLTTIAEKLVPMTPPAGPFTAAELAAAAFRMGTTLAEASAAIRAVYPEAQLPSLSPECEGLRVPWVVRETLFRSGEEISWGLGPGDIVCGALDSGLPLGDFLGELASFRALGAPVPPYDDTIRSVLNAIHIDDYDLDMLAEFDEFGSKSYMRAVSALTLVRIAGRLGWTLDEAHRRLAQLVPIGLVLKYRADIDVPDGIVYWYDLLALTTYFDGQAPVISGRIDQAYLEKAAEEIFDCRLEEIPAKASLLRQRLAIYAPLFDFELGAPEENAVA